MLAAKEWFAAAIRGMTNDGASPSLEKEDLENFSIQEYLGTAVGAGSNFSFAQENK